MPKLPDVTDLGQRPVPVSRRDIASVPNAGALGEAAYGVGAQLGQIADQRLQTQDKLEYAAAKSALLTADSSIRSEVTQDPNYAGWQQNYQQKMAAARDQAAQMITSRSQRALFEADSNLDLANGASVISGMARKRQGDDAIALGDQSLTNLAQVYASAPDDATRASILDAANDTLQALVDHGWLSAPDAFAKRHNFAQNLIVNRVTDLQTGGDLATADAFFTANRDKLDPEVESRLFKQLTDATENRENLVIANGIVNGGTPATNGVPLGNVPLTVETLRPLFSAQESSGSYTAVNKQTGALGRWQVMPQTGEALAKRIGVAWRPGLMTSDSAEAQAYQDKIGGAAIQEAIDHSGGDPHKLFSYYYSGSTTAYRNPAANPKTAQYVDDMMARLGPGQQHPASQDLGQQEAQVDTIADNHGWTPERRQQVKDLVRKQVLENQALLDRQQSQAYNDAISTANGLSDKFTNVSQLGDAYYRASPIQQRTLANMAQANLKAEAPKPNGMVALRFRAMAQSNSPRVLNDFVKTDLMPYANQMTPDEFANLVLAKEKVAQDLAKPTGQVSLRGGINSTISTFATPDLWSKDKTQAAVERLNVFDMMQSQLEALTQGKRQPTDAEYQAAFRTATQQVMIRPTGNPGLIGSLFGAGGPEDRRIYDMNIGDVPPATAQHIRDKYQKANGAQPADDEVVRIYRRFLVGRFPLQP